MLYPFCKFDYDLMYLVLLLAGGIVIFLLVYNGIKFMSDDEQTRSNGKHGAKNALIGLILIFSFSAIGCMVLGACVPCPWTVYSPPISTTPAPYPPLNVWIEEPHFGDVFNTTTNIQITGHVTGGSGSIDILWSVDDPVDKLVNSMGGTSFTHNYKKPGNYRIELTALDRDTGKRAYTYVDIVVVEKPSSSLQLKATIVKPAPGFSAHVGDDVSFNGTATGGSGAGYIYTWDYGDGDGIMMKDPIHQFTSSATFTVTLTVTDSAMASAWTTVTVFVDATP